MKNSLVLLLLVGILTHISLAQPAPAPQEEGNETTFSKEKLFESLKNATGSKAIFMGEHSAALGYLREDNELSNLSFKTIVGGYKGATQDEKTFDDVMTRIIAEIYFGRAAINLKRAETNWAKARRAEAEAKPVTLESMIPSLAEQQADTKDQAMIRLSALTAAQNQKIIQQNERIIALLEQLAKK